MEPNCKTKSINKLLSSLDGFVDSLCTNCKNRDCKHPIEDRIVVEIGIKKKKRLFIRSGDEPQAVIDCDGYLP